MQIYNPRKWFGILFQFHKSDTLRKLSRLILLIAVYTAVIAWLQLHHFDLPQQSYAKNLYQMHGLLGFALSLLLVFRTNTAYDRWWEGRRQWGALVNCSRNLAIKLQAILTPNDTHNRDFFKRFIPMYATALKAHLQSEATRVSLDDASHPELDMNKHVPNQVARLLNDRIMSLLKTGQLTGEQLLYLNPEITAFTDICGACERIKNTPIPYSYSAFIKKFIFIYVMTLPFGYVHVLGYFVIPVVAVVFYVLASLELIAEEIEDPFGTDANDLPMDKMAANISRHIAEIL
ncbi:bestrophin family protein [Chitinophagaceae bacterium MMS25-I14]